jgi:hypothetical protein
VQDGKPTGLVVELASEAAKRQGIRLQWQLERDGPEAELRSKRVDLWAATTIRPERNGIIYVSEPYREVAFS